MQWATVLESCSGLQTLDLEGCDTVADRGIQASASQGVEGRQGGSGLQHQRVPDDDVLLRRWVGHAPPSSGLPTPELGMADIKAVFHLPIVLAATELDV